MVIVVSSKPYQQPQSSNPLPPPSFVKLPDASELLNSADFSSSSLGGGTDHSSLVASAMAQSASRKRDSVGLSSSLPRSNKVPKGTLPQSKNASDTAGPMLVPPQLSGRSVMSISAFLPLVRKLSLRVLIQVLV